MIRNCSLAYTALIARDLKVVNRVNFWFDFLGNFQELMGQTVLL